MLIGSFTYLYQALNARECIPGVRKRIQCLFLIFLLSYILRTVYSILDGNYYKWIKSMYARQLIEVWLCLLWDFPSIGAILYLHHNNYGKTPRRDKGSPGELRQTQVTVVSPHNNSLINDEVIESLDVEEVDCIYADGDAAH